MNIVESLLKVALLGSAWVMYLLIALSFVSLAAMLERWLYFRRSTDPALRDTLSKALQADDWRAAERALGESRGVVAEVVGSAVRFRAGGPDAVADAADSELGRVRPELERGLNLLGTLGNNAPFIGLFGTVIGVIQAFNQLGAPGANKGAAMGSVMSGIAEALVATGVGIFVAIPAVVAYNLVQQRITGVESEIAALTKLIGAHLRTQGLGAIARPARRSASAAAEAEREDDLDVAVNVPARASE